MIGETMEQNKSRQRKWQQTHREQHRERSRQSMQRLRALPVWGLSKALKEWKEMEREKSAAQEIDCPVFYLPNGRNLHESPASTLGLARKE